MTWWTRVLAEQYGIRDASVSRLERGHTNEVYAVDAASGRFVLRRSWAGKQREFLDREATVLAVLAQRAPRIVPTQDGLPHAVDIDLHGPDSTRRFVRMFTRCDGVPGPQYLKASETGRVESAMSTLAQLHRAVDPLPTPGVPPWQWLVERLLRVRNGPRDVLPIGTDVMIERMGELFASTPIPGGTHTLHGDFHLGNLLWDGERVTAVVDFDEIGFGTAASEVAMALFALSRQHVDEEHFAFDLGLWAAGVLAYGGVAIDPTPELEQVFCAYQVLIHLEAAQRGLWKLEPGIGFWPCWNRLRG